VIPEAPVFAEALLTTDDQPVRLTGNGFSKRQALRKLSLVTEISIIAEMEPEIAMLSVVSAETLNPTSAVRASKPKNRLFVLFISITNIYITSKSSL